MSRSAGCPRRQSRLYVLIATALFALSASFTQSAKVGTVPIRYFPVAREPVRTDSGAGAERAKEGMGAA
jgi:hypothetical protein